jgi:hypothetical protein
MASVYSTTFIAQAGFAGSTSYVVPPGFIALVTNLNAYTDGVDLSSDLFLEGVAGQVVWWSGTLLATSSFHSWEGKFVAQPGQSFGLHTTGFNDWDVTVSGYLLTAP